MYPSPPLLSPVSPSNIKQAPLLCIHLHMKIHTPPSASSPYSSSPIHSSTTTSPSLASSSIDSSSSTPSTSSSPSPTPSPRCAGLDLLVKAIYQVTAGSIIGVPYIQKRVIRRRNRRSQNLIFDHTIFFNAKDASAAGVIKKQRRKGKKALNSKFQDSVLKTCRPKSRYGRDLSKLVVKL